MRRRRIKPTARDAAWIFKAEKNFLACSNSSENKWPKILSILVSSINFCSCSVVLQYVSGYKTINYLVSIAVWNAAATSSGFAELLENILIKSSFSVVTTLTCEDYLKLLEYDSEIEIPGIPDTRFLVEVLTGWSDLTSFAEFLVCLHLDTIELHSIFCVSSWSAQFPNPFQLHLHASCCLYKNRFCTSRLSSFFHKSIQGCAHVPEILSTFPNKLTRESFFWTL